MKINPHSSMVRGQWFLVFLLLNSAISVTKASPNTPVTVYCIGNRDATGACRKEGSQKEQKLDCLITSWPIVECQSIPEDEERQEDYECLALPNTGIFNQIALSCESRTNNAADKETDSLNQAIPKSTPQPESASDLDAAEQATVLERDEITPNAFQQGLDNTTFGVEKPQDFKDAF